MIIPRLLPLLITVSTVAFGTSAKDSKPTKDVQEMSNVSKFAAPETLILTYNYQCGGAAPKSQRFSLFVQLVEGQIKYFNRGDRNGLVPTPTIGKNPYYSSASFNHKTPCVAMGRGSCLHTFSGHVYVKATQNVDTQPRPQAGHPAKYIAPHITERCVVGNHCDNGKSVECKVISAVVSK